MMEKLGLATSCLMASKSKMDLQHRRVQGKWLPVLRESGTGPWRAHWRVHCVSLKQNVLADVTI